MGYGCAALYNMHMIQSAVRSCGLKWVVFCVDCMRFHISVIATASYQHVDVDILILMMLCQCQQLSELLSVGSKSVVQGDTARAAMYLCRYLTLNKHVLLLNFCAAALSTAQVQHSSGANTWVGCHLAAPSVIGSALPV